MNKKLNNILISNDDGYESVGLKVLLNIAEQLADNVLIMKDGKILEEGNTSTVLNQPKNEYTKSLLQSSLN